MGSFWISDIHELYKNNQYMQILPKMDKDMNYNMNAISRLLILLIVFFVIVDKQNPMIIFFIISFVSIIFLHYIDSNKELFSYNQLNDKDSDYDQEYSTRSAFYDSNGTLVMGKPYNYGPTYYNNPPSTNEYEKQTCRVPTKDNPFMNPPVTDLYDSSVPLPCNMDPEYDDPDGEIEKKVNQNIESKFNADLYRNIDDLFDVKNSIRQFYTIPAPTIPNDQEGFANWLYKTEGTCKDKQVDCLRYEDLRYKRLL